jgi:hypothetical protein
VLGWGPVKASPGAGIHAGLLNISHFNEIPSISLSAISGILKGMREALNGNLHQFYRLRLDIKPHRNAESLYKEPARQRKNILKKLFSEY